MTDTPANTEEQVTSAERAQALLPSMAMEIRARLLRDQALGIYSPGARESEILLKEIDRLSTVITGLGDALRNLTASVDLMVGDLTEGGHQEIYYDREIMDWLLDAAHTALKKAGR